MRAFWGATLMALAGLLCLGSKANAVDIDPATYFKGKTVTLVVDFKPGGGTDVQARYFAAHWGKFIPGNPRVVVTNLFPLPAGRNYTWASKPDGTVVSFLATADVGYEVLNPGVAFKSDGFQYIGSHTARDFILYGRGTLPYKTLKDAKGSTTPITIAEAIQQPADFDGLALSAGLLALWLNAPLKIVPIATNGTSDAMLMIERGDITAWVGGAQWYVLPKVRQGWLKTGFIRPLADMSNPDEEPHNNGESNLDLPNAVTWLTDDQKKIWRGFVLSQALTGKALATSPGTPPAVVKILRDSYAAAFHDKEFTEGIEKLQGEPAVLYPGDKLQADVTSMLGTVKEIEPQYRALEKQIYDKFVKGP